jgi:protein-S-isoprenylcysteine O-methyltransferase Ste14
MAEGIVLAVKNLLFTLLVPGTVLVVIPYYLLDGVAPRSDTFAWIGVALIGVGFAIYLRCLWSFAGFGRGTPAPIDAPKRLVVVGLYRYVRNPMYIGVFTMLMGEVALFGSRALLVYALGWLALIHLAVVLYEEPTLRASFGEDYARYCRHVRRWIPRLDPNVTADLKGT